MQSTKPTIQKLMHEVDVLDPKDPDLETKLRLIAEKVAQEQQKIKAKTHIPLHRDTETLTDPSEAFACEGCQ